MKWIIKPIAAVVVEILLLAFIQWQITLHEIRFDEPSNISFDKLLIITLLWQFPSSICLVTVINFIHGWRVLQFNVDSERQIFEKLFHDRFIYSQSFYQKSTEKKSPKKYFFIFRFDVWTVIGIVKKIKEMLCLPFEIQFIQIHGNRSRFNCF